MRRINIIFIIWIVFAIGANARERQGLPIWTRLSTSFAKAHDYHGGSNSVASMLFDGTLASADYEILSYQLEGSLGVYQGFYLYAGVNYSDSNINDKAGTPANVNDDTDVRLRAYTLGLGRAWHTNYGTFKGEFFYNKNEDDDFVRTRGIPVTNGSDSLMLSLFGEKELWGLKNRLRISYQNYEGAESGDFTLGDSYQFTYELGKQCNRFYLGMRHGYAYSEETEGNFIYERPRYVDLTLTSDFRISDHFSIDSAIGYIYAGSDAPEQTQFTVGLNYSY